MYHLATIQPSFDVIQPIEVDLTFASNKFCCILSQSVTVN
jgi:hypothetical protein